MVHFCGDRGARDARLPVLHALWREGAPQHVQTGRKDHAARHRARDLQKRSAAVHDDRNGAVHDRLFHNYKLWNILFHLCIRRCGNVLRVCGGARRFAAFRACGVSEVQRTLCAQAALFRRHSARGARLPCVLLFADEHALHRRGGCADLRGAGVHPASDAHVPCGHHRIRPMEDGQAQ